MSDEFAATPDWEPSATPRAYYSQILPDTVPSGTDPVLEFDPPATPDYETDYP